MERKIPSVAFVAQDPVWTRRVRAELRRRGAVTSALTSAEEIRRCTAAAVPDVFIVQQGMTDGQGRPLEDWVRESFDDAKVLLTASPGKSPTRPRKGPPVLPCEADAILDAVASVLQSRLGDPVAPGRSKPLVLCVDDDRFYLDSLARILSRHGYRVASYEDPERAIEALPRVNPDVAILDVMMPGVDGFDLAGEIRRCFRDIPVILLTAKAADEDISRGYRQGASYYLTKPCDPTKVLNILDYLVGDLDPQERERLEAQL